MARVDVLIPAYNAASTIRSAVESILAQTETDLAVHVVDDGSTDATPAILARIAAIDPRVHVHSKANGGIVDALNDGLGFCTAPFVARHDADDLAAPERLAVQLAWLDANPDAVAVGAAVRHIDVDDAPTGHVARLVSPDLSDAFATPSIEPYIIHPFLTARREAVVAAGGYRHVHHAEDTDLYWRLQEQGRLHNLPDILGDYRMHDASISGGSIVNGRIMAVNSQRAALSARRRARGVPDILFPRDGLAAYKQAGTLAAMVELGGRDLDADEREYLAAASGAKLLELTTYRPYELEAADCRFIGTVARHGSGAMTVDNRALHHRHLSGTAARIAATGRLGDALQLLPPALLPGFIARTLMRVALPAAVRDRLRSEGARGSRSK